MDGHDQNICKVTELNYVHFASPLIFLKYELLLSECDKYTFENNSNSSPINTLSLSLSILGVEYTENARLQCANIGVSYYEAISNGTMSNKSPVI